MALEDLIREAATRGLTHLSLSPTPSEDGKTTYWAARATPSTEHKYIMCATRDPVDAVEQVLKALPKAPARGTRKKGGERVQSVPVEELAVTATVTEPEPPLQETPAPTETIAELVTSPAPLNLEEEFASWLPKP